MNNKHSILSEPYPSHGSASFSTFCWNFLAQSTALSIVARSASRCLASFSALASAGRSSETTLLALETESSAAWELRVVAATASDADKSWAGAGVGGVGSGRRQMRLGGGAPCTNVPKPSHAGNVVPATAAPACHPAVPASRGDGDDSGAPGRGGGQAAHRCSDRGGCPSAPRDPANASSGAVGTENGENSQSARGSGGRLPETPRCRRRENSCSARRPKRCPLACSACSVVIDSDG